VGVCDTLFVTIPVLMAEVHGGKVAAFYLRVGAEGD